MIINFICNDYMSTITLPQKVSGQYWFTDAAGKKFTCVEAVGDEWQLKAPADYELVRGGESHAAGSDPSGAAVLSGENELLIFKRCKGKPDPAGSRIYAFVEQETEDRMRYRLVQVPDPFEITVGSGRIPRTLTYQNHYVSTEHLVLRFQGGRWIMTDEKSLNGTFVNGIRQTNAELKYGDLIFVMGLKMIVGNGFLALNNPEGRAVLHADALKPLIPETYTEEESDEELPETETQYFDRSPRFKRDITPAEIQIESPPSNGKGEEMPVILTIGPAMTMAMASMTTGIFAVINALSTGNVRSAIPSIAMSGSMCLGTLLWPTLTRKYQSKVKAEKEKLRRSSYNAYLEERRTDIKEKCELQCEILHENRISMEECEQRILNRSNSLWNRSIGQNDFLELRIGTGTIPMYGKLNYNAPRFSIQKDDLEAKMTELCESPNVLQDVPVAVSLLDESIGIVGEKEQIRSFAVGLLIQLAALCSYDEVKLIVLYDRQDAEQLEFVKWLPHVWNQEKTFRFVATDAAEAKVVSEYLERIISYRLELSDADLADEQPYYLIFALSKTLFQRVPCIRNLLSSKKDLHMTVAAVFGEFNLLPKECAKVIELWSENGAPFGKLYDKNDTSGAFVEFRPDLELHYDPAVLSRQLANTELDSSDAAAQLPKMITFLQLMNVGKVEHLNALLRWKENNPIKSLATPVGVNAFGDEFVLDLHERAHGPHGLIAGMTGSGKSEFIITYILSLAVNFHPEEVSFILIDYKGGGMAQAFLDLPHTAGIITNLDGSAIKRSLVSINSELKRRQSLLSKASSLIGESNINIYQYQRLYRERLVSEPLSHLFIIADEFAELKTQQSEFMTELTSAARIGRSLGVHLILATQKPSGVVDEQILSNTRFRVCLKVQDKQDSMDMLKRPDAAELSDTGRFYLQVGYNELFEIGQSAWAGAEYFPADKVLLEKDDSVDVIDMNGHVLRSAKPPRHTGLRSDAKKTAKQLDTITQYLRRVADEEHVHARALWLDPIPAVVTIDTLRKKYAADYAKTQERFVLNPLIGEYDDPAHQAQGLLTLPISAEGNVLIYGAAGSGKSMLLNMILYSLILEHSAQELNLYLLDFDETLRAFRDAPQVGDILLGNDSEKLLRLIRHLYAEIRSRKKLLSGCGMDYQQYVNAHPDCTGMPAIIVLVNNYASFAELFGDSEDDILFLSREGVKYGIYFILTATTQNSVRYRITQNFKQFLMLQVNDPSDYSTVFGKTDGLYPAKIPGRGLVKHGAILEFQTAAVTDGEAVFDAIRRKCSELRSSWKGACAEPIPVLPDVVDVAFAEPHLRPDTPWMLPVGVNKSTLKMQYYDFSAKKMDIVLSQDDSYADFISMLTRLLVSAAGFSVIVFDPDGKLELDAAAFAGTGLKLCQDQESCKAEIRTLFDETVRRFKAHKAAVADGQPIPEFEKCMLIFVSAASVIELFRTVDAAGTDDEAKYSERFQLIMEKMQTVFRMHAIFADTAKAVSNYSFNTWYKTQISEGDGIWMGGGVTEQYQLKTAVSDSSMRTPIASPLGYVFQKGKAVLCKMLAEGGDESDG